MNEEFEPRTSGRTTMCISVYIPAVCPEYNLQSGEGGVQFYKQKIKELILGLHPMSSLK